MALGMDKNTSQGVCQEREREIERECVCVCACVRVSYFKTQWRLAPTELLFEAVSLEECSAMGETCVSVLECVYVSAVYL